MGIDGTETGLTSEDRSFPFPVSQTGENEEPSPYRRGLLTIQAVLDPSPAPPGVAHVANGGMKFHPRPSR